MSIKTTSALMLMLGLSCQHVEAYYQVLLPLPQRATNLETFFMNGDYQLRFRPRFEYVYDNLYDQSTAQALTLSSRLTYHTAEWFGFLGLLDFNNVSSFLKHNQSVLPQEKATALAQAYLAFESIPDTILIAGRQIISLDNQRFVGPSSFRQMPQTFDSALFFNESLRNVELFYAFVGRVNSVWQGNDNAFFPERQNTTHLVNISSDLAPLGELVAYGYFIHDFDIPLFSTHTLGLQYTNEIEFRYADVYSLAEYARQRNQSNHPLEYHANYFHFVMGMIISYFDIQGGYEVLGGDDKTPGKAFQTPLASQHIFNGLAEQFIIIPAPGLRDLYANLKINAWDVCLFGQYHYFRAEANSNRYGIEWDAGLSYTFLKNYEIALEYDHFAGNRAMGYFDVRKIWVTLDAKFG